MTVGVYGKVPAQGDFLRINVTDPAILAFIQWLEEANEAAYRMNGELTSDPVYFFFRSPTTRNVVTGAFAPSFDSVGRTFPMVVFHVADAAIMQTRMSALPVLYSPFYTEATNILSRSTSYTSATLSEAIRRLPTPTTNDLNASETISRNTLERTAAGDVTRRLFGDVTNGKACYAVRTFLSACESFRGKEPAKATLTLDCPTASDVDLFTWLELARRVLRWPVAFPFFWTETQQSSRVLIPIGPPPPLVLVYLTKPERAGNKLWPLTTERSDAIEIARQSLAPTHRRVIEDSTVSLEMFLSSLSS